MSLQNHQRKALKIGAAVFLAAVALNCFLWGFAVRTWTRTGFAMGSALTQRYWGKGPAERVAASIASLEEELTGATVAPPLALEVMEASGGAFDPCLGALTRLWNIDGRDGSPPHVPTHEEIDRALLLSEVDLGAYGKGAACDAALRILERHKTRAAVINLGGNVVTHGQKPWGRPFQIALRDPRGGPNEALGTFTLQGTRFISTSGSYEKYFERGGLRYHHIFDPETGYPAARDPGLISVTVLTEGENGGALGDMLSTACFVLGYEDSQGLLTLYNCDALFIYETGKVRGAGAIENYFALGNDDYHWVTP